MLVVYQDRRWLIERVAAGLDSLEVPWLALSSKRFQPPGRARKKYLYASRDPARLADIEQGFAEAGFKPQVLALEDAPPLTDDRPVAAPSAQQGQLVRRALFLAVVAVLSLAGVLALAGPSGGTVVAFTGLGAGFLGLQLYAVARFRDLFDSPIATITAVTVCFLGGTVLGNLASLRGRVVALASRRGPLLAVTGGALLWVHGTTSLLPFHTPESWVRGAAAVACLVPVGVVCGLFFPLGLGRTPAPLRPLALLSDGVGTCLGFVGFYAMTWTLGASAALLPAALGYLVCAAWLTATPAVPSALPVVGTPPPGP